MYRFNLLKLSDIRPTLVAMVMLMLVGATGLNAQQTEDKVQLRLKAVTKQGIESLSNTVSVFRPLSLYIPTAFTPDGDGINDLFKVEGEGFRDVSMQIYDGWGNTVFESDDATLAWNGTYNGTRMSVGVYAYKVVAVDHQNHRTERLGSISLLIP